MKIRKDNGQKKQRWIGRRKDWRRKWAKQVIAIVLLGTMFVPVFSFLKITEPFQADAAIGLGIETVYDDEIWMGWTIFESGNVGYGQAGGDGGRAYGRYQFDYQYALPEFLTYVVSTDSDRKSVV